MSQDELQGPPPYNRRALVSYGALALPLAFGGLPVYLHAPDYHVTMNGLSLTTLGVTLLVLRLADAIQDPLVGWLGDRYPESRHRHMQAGAAMLLVGFFLLFLTPPIAPLPWFVMAMLCATFGHSVLAVNLNTIGGLWRRAPAEKNAVAAVREGFGLAGLILAVSLPPILAPLLGKQTGFLLTAVLLLFAIICLFPLFNHWYRRAKLELDSHPPEKRLGFSASNLLSGIARVLAVPGFRLFYLSCFLAFLSASIPAVLIIMITRDLLQAESQTGLFLLLYFVSALPGLWLWNRLARKIGNTRTWKVALLLSVFAFAAATQLQAGAVWLFAVICVMTGVTFAADLTQPSAILSEKLDHHARVESATSAYALLAFLAKAALALASAAVYITLGLAEFEANGINDAQALATLTLLYGALPCVIRLFAIVTLNLELKHES